MDINIFYHSGGFASTGHSAHCFFSKTVSDNNIFSWLIHSQSVNSASGFERKTIITTTKSAIFNQHIFTGRNIYTIPTGNAYRIYSYSSDDYTIRINRNNIPKYRVFYVNPLYIYLFTIHR